MTKSPADYADISLSLRAPRIAIVIDGGEGWTYWMRLASFEMTRRWGGAAFIVIPHQLGNVSAQLLDAAAAYDPDFVVSLRPTIGQWEQVHPGSIALEDGSSGVLLEGQKRADVIAQNADQNMHDEVSQHARDIVAKRCSVYRRSLGQSHEDHEDLVFLDAGIHSRFPVTDIESDKRPRIAANPNWTGRFGVAASLAVGMMHPPIELSVDPPEDAVIESVLSWIYSRTIGSLSGVPAALAEPGNTPATVLRAAPTALDSTSTGLGWITAGFRHPHRGLIVVGDSAEDCALALAYDRLYGSGYWIPSDWAIAGSSRISSAVRVALDQVVDNHTTRAVEFAITSTSLEIAELESTRAKLLESWLSSVSVTIDGDPVLDSNDRAERIKVSAVEWSDKGRRHLALSEEFDQRFTVPVIRESDGSIAMVAPPPVPMTRNRERADSLRLSWQVDVDFLESTAPACRGLPAETMLARPDTEQYLTWVRSGRNGISYQAKRFDLILQGTPMELQLARPRLRAPGMLSWASAISKLAHYSVRLSDSGLRAELLASMWGTRQNLATELAGPLLPALRQFAARGKSTKDAFPNGGGCYVAGLGAFLSFEGFCAFWGDQDADRKTVRSSVDSLAGVGVIRRGLLLICPVCTRPAFVSVDDLAQKFRCPRCGSKSELTYEMWKHPVGEPEWFYDLHPVGRELLLSNGVEPLLLSSFLRRESRQYADLAELELVQAGKSKVEVDLLAYRDGQVITAEVKSSSTLGSTAPERNQAAVRRMLAASVLRADCVYMATTQTSWESASVTAVKNALATFQWDGHRRPVIKLVEELGTVSVSERELL